LPDEYFEALLLRLYVGNLTASGLFVDAPLNTDNHPLIEYLAPQTHRQVEAGDRRFLVGHEREQLYAAFQDANPPDRDPYLAQITPAQLGYVQAGHSYSQFVQLNHARMGEAAAPFLQDFEALSPPGTRNALSPAIALLPATPSGCCGCATPVPMCWPWPCSGCFPKRG
jgi:spermidine synthase